MRTTATATGALLCIGSTAASAYVPMPEMKFLAAPAIEVAGDAAPRLFQVRDGDSMTVVARDRAVCGQRSLAPSIGLDGDALRIGYRVPSPAVGAPACMTTTMFTLTHLPQHVQHVEVVPDAAPAADPGAAPSTTAPGVLRFLALPAIPGDPVPRLQQLRFGDQLTAVIRDSAACGQRPANPRVALVDGALHLGYDLPVPETTQIAQAPAAACVATAVFTLGNLPPQPLDLIAEAARTRAQPSDGAATAAAPSMQFISVPAAAVGAEDAADGHEVLQVRAGELMNVIVRERTGCGERPTQPSFDLREDRLELRYSLPDPAADARATHCVAVAIFTLKNLPQRELRTIASRARRTEVLLAGSAR